MCNMHRCSARPQVKRAFLGSLERRIAHMTIYCLRRGRRTSTAGNLTSLGGQRRPIHAAFDARSRVFLSRGLSDRESVTSNSRPANRSRSSGLQQSRTRRVDPSPTDCSIRSCRPHVSSVVPSGGMALSRRCLTIHANRYVRPDRAWEARDSQRHPLEPSRPLTR